MLDGSLAEPVGKFVFADSLYHPVQHAIEKILADRRPRLSLRPGNDTINDAAEIDIPVDLMRQPEGAKFFHLQVDDIRLFVAKQAGNLFWRSDIDLRDDLGLAIYPGNLLDIEVGSSFFGFYVKMRLTSIIPVGSYMSSKIFHDFNIYRRFGQGKCFYWRVLRNLVN